MSLDRASADVHVADDDIQAFGSCESRKMLLDSVLRKAISDRKDLQSILLGRTGSKY